LNAYSPRRVFARNHSMFHVVELNPSTVPKWSGER
jgi:hypothetical protein